MWSPAEPQPVFDDVEDASDFEVPRIFEGGGVSPELDLDLHVSSP